MNRFPGAPPGFYISEEGWLVYRNEAWTEQEWAATPPDERPKGRPVKKERQRVMPQRGNRYGDDDEARRAADRRHKREYMRRYRAREVA